MTKPPAPKTKSLRGITTERAVFARSGHRADTDSPHHKVKDYRCVYMVEIKLDGGVLPTMLQTHN
ncbi:MAG UNVERIFIED_CONTAM: hypothetical protein LVT10_06695 [Anaerolineae bacterium]